MTKEELLQHHIYCPVKLDKSIKVYLNLGFHVLLHCKVNETK